MAGRTTGNITQGQAGGQKVLQGDQGEDKDKRNHSSPAHRQACGPRNPRREG